jgi:hypothetical protein
VIIILSYHFYLKTFSKIKNEFRKVNIVDLMFKMIEDHKNNLENLVREKTLDLEQEKKKTEELLKEMLPQ